jgi:hypothetical protein
MQHHMVMMTGRNDEQGEIDGKASERGTEKAAMEPVAARRLDRADRAQPGPVSGVHSLDQKRGQVYFRFLWK